MMLQKSENAVITRKGDLKKRLIRYKWMYPMLLPGLIILFIFSYMPLYGLLMAFQDFDIVSGISGSPWVGLDNFRQIFASPGFLKVLRNSLLISFYRLLWGFPAPIVLALMLNELPSKKFRKISQTAIYLPHFISWVVLVGIVQTFLSPSGGLINIVLEAMGKPSVAFLQKPEYFRTIIVATDVWKETGWGTIMYLAALSGINPELYEAAMIDGCGRMKMIRHITLLGLLLTVMMSYALSKKDLPGRGFFMTYVIFTSLFSGGIIPGFYLMKSIGLIDSLWALILPTMLASFNIVLMKNFFEGLPANLEEAARIDGAGEIKILTDVILPISKPIIATIALFIAVSYWNSYFSAILYIRSQSKWTLQLVMREIISSAETTALTAGSNMAEYGNLPTRLSAFAEAAAELHEWTP